MTAHTFPGDGTALVVFACVDTLTGWRPLKRWSRCERDSCEEDAHEYSLIA